MRVLSGTRPVKSWPDPVRSGLTWSNLVWSDLVRDLSGYGLSDT